MHNESFLTDLQTNFGQWYLSAEKRKMGEFSVELYPYDKLFSPLKINSLELKNRVVMAPMGNINMAEENGRPSAALIAYFAERARGGVGLLTSGLVPVTAAQDPTLTEVGGLSYFPRLGGSRTNLAGWRDLASACHAFDAKFFIQLSAGLGRVGNPECLLSKKRFPVSASYNPNFYLPQIPCLRLSDRKIKRMVQAIAQASADAKAMDIDGVYLHGHEGYLLEQLSNRAFNRRRFGRYADWQRFGLDTVAAIRERVGPDYPIMYRLDLSLMLQACYGEELKTVKALRKFGHERSVAESLAYMAALVKAGVDVFDVDLGCYDNWWLPHPPTYMPPGCFIPVAQMVKEYFQAESILSNKGLPVPVAAVGKLGYPDLAESVLRQEQADLIMLGRPLLADPDWVRKTYAGKVSSIRPCIGCQEACINEFIQGGHPCCAVNPRTAFENVYPAQPLSVTATGGKRKKIAVVGAGPAGLECALTAAERGQQVWLFDQESTVGGSFHLAAKPLAKLDLANYVQWLQFRVNEAVAKGSLNYCPNTIATMNMLEDGHFDAIVCATGGQARILDLPGKELCLSARAFFAEPKLAAGKQHIVICGAGQAGLEIAWQLQEEFGLGSTVLEAGDKLLPEVCTANRAYLLHYLDKTKVQVRLGCELKGVQADKVLLRQNKALRQDQAFVRWTPILPPNIPNPFAKKVVPEWEEAELACDLCIMATGSRAEDSLYRELRENYCAPEIYRLGDAAAIGRLREATTAGYRLGLAL